MIYINFLGNYIHDGTILINMTSIIKKIKYGDFLSIKSDIVTIINDKNQNWELKRTGISENEIKKLVKEVGKNEAIFQLIQKGNLIPIYGGELNI